METKTKKKNNLYFYSCFKIKKNSCKLFCTVVSEFIYLFIYFISTILNSILMFFLTNVYTCFIFLNCEILKKKKKKRLPVW